AFPRRRLGGFAAALAGRLLLRRRRAALARRSTLGDFIHAALGRNRPRLLLEDVPCARATRVRVVRLDQQPRILALAFPLAHPHQVPAAVQLFAVEAKVEPAGAVAFERIAFRMPAAAVPDHHRAAAILALRDGALERVVLDRMVL